MHGVFAKIVAASCRSFPVIVAGNPALRPGIILVLVIDRATAPWIDSPGPMDTASIHFGDGKTQLAAQTVITANAVCSNYIVFPFAYHGFAKR